MEDISTDILIVGAGVAGSAITTALKNSPFTITVVETRQPGKDLNRGDVLFPSSIEIINEWGALEFLKNKGALPFEKLITYDQENPLFEMDFTDINPLFPYSLSLDHTLIEDSLLEFAQTEKLRVLRGFSAVEHVLNQNGTNSSTLLGGGKQITVHSKLLIGADGRNSKVRDAMGISITPKTYASESVVFWMPLKKSMPVGVFSYVKPPLAVVTQVLPPGNRLRISLEVLKDNGKTWIAQNPEDKLKDLLTFSSIFTFTEPIYNGEHIYTVRSQNSPTYHHGNVVLVGDAAHEVHPLSAQGISMAIADAYVLGKIIDNSLANIPAKLTAYETIRRGDVEKIVTHSHLVAKALTTEYPGSQEVKNILVFLLSHSPLFKKIFTQGFDDFEYGFIGKSPKMPQITNES